MAYCKQCRYRQRQAPLTKPPLQTTMTQCTAAYQLDCNGQTLPLLHAEAADAWHTHDRVAQTAQLHQVHDLIHKGINGVALNLKGALLCLRKNTAIRAAGWPQANHSHAFKP